MKLDKIAFASVVRFITELRPEVWLDIVELDNLIDVPVPEAKAGTVPTVALDELLALMAEGTRLIEAIKTYRHLTGKGLKESKDAIERHWVRKPQAGTLGDILGDALKNK